MQLGDAQARYDLVVIGGGITGAGIFREAARAGVSVLLVEARDFASGTSSWSSKLVHGGLRYLQTGQWRLTAESVRERQRLLREAPTLVEPLDFLMPFYAGGKPSRGLVRLALWLYDRFGDATTTRSTSLDISATLAVVSGLRPERLVGALRYCDARTDDCRLVWRLIEQGLRDGGQALSYVKAESLVHAQGRTAGVVLRDVETGATREIAATVVINATGIWSAALQAPDRATPRLRPLRGSHLVYPHARLPLACAVSFFHPRDRRPVFAYPWQGATLIGTTDLDHREDLWNPRVSRAEADYLLEAFDWLMPTLALRLDEALSCFAGVRAIVDDGEGKPSAASRESEQWVAPGFIGITGGKLTTFRVTARQVLKAAARELPALRLADDRAPLFNSDRDRDGDGGDSPSRPVSARQLHQRAGERVRHLDDLLLRRTRVGLVLPGFGEALIEPAVTACRTVLGWDDDRCAAEVSRYREHMRAQHVLPGV